MTDASEEYWPADTLRTLPANVKHLPVFRGNESVSTGINIREGFEYFKDYQWGIGPQDRDGYFLHRALLHSNFRYSRYFRLFTELQSSLISGRNGGPRPAQDQNKLAVNQLFAEVSVSPTVNSRLRLRLGKQYLKYGQGTLLDLRDANVRRSFIGGKLLLETKRTRLDVFAMKAIAVRPGVLDDAVDQDQTIGGLWLTQNFPVTVLAKIDLYYLVTDRDDSHYNQGSGKELRHTAGTGLSLDSKDWFSFTELDFQWGKFNKGSILAWKIAPSFGYRLSSFALRPVISVQGAISSGDGNANDNSLQTFSPIYPKAIFYGYIDNAGSSNLIVIHPKVELRITMQIILTVNYYRFWRESLQDGLYAVNGAFLLPAADAGKHVGDMYDLFTQYQAGKHVSFQFISAYYRRGSYLRGNSDTKSDILYFGLRTAINI
ncbi:alginate export family protein [Taibaiella koreensis]|uniref:alginate export family protein n=1 Tax=Taibaiella koreensis TaxID=1268548 RepID=UPI0013C2C793|nr:alginate export family protein [Taibaiella koreensis]